MKRRRNKLVAPLATLLVVVSNMGGYLALQVNVSQRSPAPAPHSVVLRAVPPTNRHGEDCLAGRPPSPLYEAAAGLERVRENPTIGRRALVDSVAAATLAVSSVAPRANAEVASTRSEEGAMRDFRTGAWGREELTNSIVASRDTNISPREVYDSIASSYLKSPLSATTSKTNGNGDAGSSGRLPRALDVGAGAGVSTQVLWEMGYRDIDAVDWSGSAWDRFVTDDPAGQCPPSVRFYELDDERYLDKWRSSGRDKFDAIVFNFAVNEGKARLFASELLADEGRLLAPVNTQTDYWLKQTYKVFDKSGKVLWSTVDVGAWSVQFQPDVTQDTCQGIWCPPFNGFQKKR